MKWLVFIALAVMVLLLLFRNGLAWLANFMPWAKSLLDAWNRFWGNLFGRTEGAGDAEAEAEEPAVRHVPFAAFSNPFHDGSAVRRSPEDLVRYTFAAFEAWGREHGPERTEDETALEYTRRVGDAFPGLDEAARRLGGLYARVAYAGREPPAKTERILEEFWDRLETVGAAPLSA